MLGLAGVVIGSVEEGRHLQFTMLLKGFGLFGAFFKVRQPKVLVKVLPIPAG